MKIHDMLLEQFLANEVTNEERQRVVAAINTDSAVAARVAELEQSNSEILSKYPAKDQVHFIKGKLRVEQARAAQQRRRRQLTLFAPLAMAATLLFAVGMWTTTSPSPTVGHNNDGLILAKGGAASLKVMHQGKSGPTPILTNDKLHQGDVLQLVYQRGKFSHGVIVSVDGAGQTTLHFPANERSSTALEHGSTALQYGYELDNAPKFERFFLVVSEGELNPTAILGQARKLAKSNNATTEPLRVSHGRVMEVLVHKEE